MIVFKEKQYSKAGVAGKIKRTLVPVLQGTTGMTKKEAIRTVASGSVHGTMRAASEVGNYAKKNPGAVIGSVVGTAVPIPGASIIGTHAGKKLQTLLV